MGRKKKFIDKKKSATFQLLARDSSDPNFDDSPGNDRVFVRVSGSGQYDETDSIFADADDDHDVNEDEDRVFGTTSAPPSRKTLPEHVRREILELGFPDDGYNYLNHMKEAGGGSAFYNNPKARLDELPRDVKAYDASRVRIAEVDGDDNGKSIFTVAAKTVGVRVQKAVDPEVAALLDDSDLSRFGSDNEDLEEDFVVQANLAEGEEDVEVDERLNTIEEFEENIENEADNEVVDGLVFQSGVKNQLVKGDECAGEEARVRRLLDEQFDLLEHQEYGTDDDDDDDDYDGYVAEEEESLAEKLKYALGDNLRPLQRSSNMLDDKYKAPADLLHDNDIPKSKEQVDSAADVIHRIVEYAEKYENENENEDKDLVVVQESSDESEIWDCETIVSTYSNLDNHPGKIDAPGIKRKKKLVETVSRAMGATSHVISLRGKEKFPVDFLPPSRKPAAEKVKDIGSNKAEQQQKKPLGQESKEEKKERKAAIKEERREARRVKKEMKELYRSEAQRAQKVAAVSCSSSIHLI